jgi:hypothetical protein
VKEEEKGGGEGEKVGERRSKTKRKNRQRTCLPTQQRNIGQIELHASVCEPQRPHFRHRSGNGIGKVVLETVEEVGKFGGREGMDGGEMVGILVD